MPHSSPYVLAPCGQYGTKPGNPTGTRVALLTDEPLYGAIRAIRRPLAKYLAVMQKESAQTGRQPLHFSTRPVKQGLGRHVKRTMGADSPGIVPLDEVYQH